MRVLQLMSLATFALCAVLIYLFWKQSKTMDIVITPAVLDVEQVLTVDDMLIGMN